MELVVVPGASKKVVKKVVKKVLKKAVNKKNINDS